MKDVFAFLKLIIIASIAGGFLLIGYTFYDAYDNQRIFAPAPPPTANEIAMASFDAQIWALIRLALWVLFLAALTLAIVRFLYVPAINSRERIPFDPTTGLAPVVRRNVAPFWQRMIGHNEYDELDPNLATVPHRKISSNGTLRVMAESGGLDPHSQADYARGSWAVQGSVARKGRGVSVGESRLLSGEAAARAELQRMKLDAARAKAKVIDTPALSTIALPVRPVDAIDAFKSMTDTEFPLGYSDDGQVVSWDVESSPHIRVHGKTQGSGKTNVIKTIAVAALCAGHRVIVLDRRGFKDWKVFEDCVELIDNRQTGTMAAVAYQIEGIYQGRDAELGAAGVGNLAAMGGNERRIFLVVSEFGTACRSQDEPHLLAAVNSLKNIFSEAGASGVHLIFEDQVVNRSWPRELRGNADPITGYLPEDTAKGGGYSKAHELDRYQFHYEGERFRTWNMNVYAARLLVRVPPLHERLIDLDSVRSFVRSFGKKEILPDSAQKITFTERTNTERTATELQALVWQWRDVNPDGSQSQMRSAFAEKQIIISRGYAHQCWHNWPGQKES